MKLEAPFNLFGQGLNGDPAPANPVGLPKIKANMAPPANFWEGNNFRIGAPGLQETPVNDPSHPANPATPAPAPTQPPPNFTPPPVDPRQSYLNRYPDLMNAYQAQNIVSSPHLLRGGGKGTDTDGNGRISPLEFAQFHYDTMGRNEGRTFGAPAKSPIPYMGNPFAQVPSPVQVPIKNPFLARPPQ
tara:strand:- start:4820 stop:5380 length:561 start_codon:yes stop_codon:yes gene_type:complete